MVSARTTFTNGLHPVAVFGLDIFAHLFKLLVKERISPLTFMSRFQFCASMKFKSASRVRPCTLYWVQQQTSFFSPLVYRSKILKKFPQFLLSGTGINFQYVKEALESSAMKRDQMNFHQMLSDLRPLSKSDVEEYST